MKNPGEVHQLLGLTYEKNQLPIIEPSVEPNGGVLNIERALNDNPECWDIITQGSTQLEKKTIILNWQCTEEIKDKNLKKIIISKFIEDGFDVFYPSDEGLIKLKNPDELDFPNFEAITPDKKNSEIKKLKSTSDRVEFLDDNKLNELCEKTLKSPDLFFYFNNVFQIENLFDLFPIADGMECVFRDFKNGINWSSHTASDSDPEADWKFKHRLFEDKTFNQNELLQLSPHFLPEVSKPDITSNEKLNLYLNYVLKNNPDILKKISYATLANADFNLITFLNQAESLLSLAIKVSAVKPLEEEVLHNTSLRNLNLDDTDIPIEILSEILIHSPNLVELELHKKGINCDFALDLGHKKLLKLRKLALDSLIDLSVQHLNEFLNAAPNLSDLLIDASVDHNEVFHINSPLAQLKKIRVQRSMKLEAIYHLINSAPNVQELSLFRVNNVNTKIWIFKNEHSFSDLKKISIEESTFSGDQITSILTAIPNVQNFDLLHCNLIGRDPIVLKANSLRDLANLDASGTELTASELKCFIDAAPNLNFIGIRKFDDFSEFLNDLKPDSMPSLNRLVFGSDCLTVSELIQWIKIAPNLHSIVMQRPGSDVAQAITWFQQSYPNINIVYLDKPSENEQNYGIQSNAYAPSLDGDISKKKDQPILPARTLFKAKGTDQPHFSYYHLRSFHWDSSSRSFKQDLPNDLNLEVIHESLRVSNQEIEDAFNNQDISSQYIYGQISFDKPPINQWIQLPALSISDKLVNYGASNSNVELKKDKLSGYHFIKFNQDTATCHINYMINPRENRDETLNQVAPVQHLQWLANCSFGKDGKLIDSIDYQNLLKLNWNQRIQALAAFCRFEEESAAKNIEGDAIDVLNGLIKTRAGVCRHRAQLFVAMASSLGIDSSLINNDVHEFVRVTDTHHSYTVDLGGAEADIVNLPMPAVPKKIEDPLNSEQQKKFLKDEKEKSEKTQKTVVPLNANNRFQTWNSFPIEAQDGEELFKKLTDKSSFSRQWLIFKDKQGIETLHHASAPYKNSFFSQDLDGLKLDSIRIENGKDYRVDSMVSQFLKTATANPNESFTWFINWSDPKGRHVALNSIIDTEGRNIGGLSIPSNVRIVVATDQASAAKMGDDFYSRFDGISQAPVMSSIALPEIKTNQPISDSDILFPSSLNWESILLGRHSIDNGTLDVIPGALMKASVNKIKQLTLQNAPLEDPKFRFFIKELLTKKSFFFNGEWHDLAEDFQFKFATPDLSTFPPVINPVGESKCTRILNQTTFPLFFNQYKIGENHTLNPQSGFLASDSSINLVVTDNLTEIQWYVLLKEANERKCALTITNTPNVFIPKPLRTMVKSIEPLKQNNRLISAIDLDAAEEHYKDTQTISINVDEKTNFNSLFYHVSLKNREFNGQETALLEAIKQGKPVILKGQFSITLAQQLQSLFIDPSSLRVNGESVPVKNLTVLTNDTNPFKSVAPVLHEYKPEHDFNRLGTVLAEQLQKAYQRLRLVPCHSHFINLPDNSALHGAWVDDLIKRLEWQTGLLPETNEPTTPETVMNYLGQHSFVFLTSKTGAGKSHFVHKTLREYSNKQNKPITIYHELTSIKDWLTHKDSSQPILFLDEANLANEHYTLFEALARGDKEFWFEGECYPLKNHKIIFAGNPTHYEGRFEPDLFKRYPNYLPFQGESLKNILNPLILEHENPPKMLELIEAYYGKAQDAGLNITPRNAQMMCLRYFVLKQLPETQLMPDNFLLRYAILNEIKALSFDKTLSKDIRADIKQSHTWKNNKGHLKEAIQQQVPKTNNEQFIWTASRNKAIYAIETLLMIREKKLKGQFKQEHGINGLILEGEPGLGKSKLVSYLLKAKGIDYITIPPTDAKSMQSKLLEAFHKGQVVVVDEFNTLIHEQLLNALLSGYDLDGNPPNTPGFCIIGTQNPVTFHGRQPLSKALDNRLMHIELSHYSLNEFKEILTKKFKMNPDDAVKLTEEYISARKYAKEQGLFPPPNPRNILNKAEEEQINTKGNLV